MLMSSAVYTITVAACLSGLDVITCEFCSAVNCEWFVQSFLPVVLLCFPVFSYAFLQLPGILIICVLLCGSLIA